MTDCDYRIAGLLITFAVILLPLLIASALPGAGSGGGGHPREGSRLI